ncbi:ATP-binding cassette domain-containing protein [Fluviispira vulneris]|uniref:ATP-binding cassette domain-containing protein n=1 Tax=Fluviispira vulneris TaxID=2763012 RepID=UPI0016472EF7|nr:ABC transporter ATP-binding protein [Fluviispira vulneris]
MATNDFSQTFQQLKLWTCFLLGKGIWHKIFTISIFLMTFITFIFPYIQTSLLLDFSDSKSATILIPIVTLSLMLGTILFNLFLEISWKKISIEAANTIHNMNLESLLFKINNFDISYIKTIFLKDQKIIDLEISESYQRFFFLFVETAIIFIFVSYSIPIMILFFVLVLFIYNKLQASYRSPAYYSKKFNLEYKTEFSAYTHQINHLSELILHKKYFLQFEDKFNEYFKKVQSSFYLRINLNRWFSTHIFIYSNFLQFIISTALLVSIKMNYISETIFCLIFTLLAQISQYLSEIIRMLNTFEAQAVSFDNMNKVTETEIARNDNNIVYTVNDPKAIIEFERIYFAYMNSKKSILNDFNFSILKNSKTLIFGKSGAGKSTLIKLLIQEIYPTKGHIRFLKPDLKISYVQQQPPLLLGNCKENIDFLNIYKNEDLEMISKKLSIDLQSNSQTHSYNRETAQKISIARALIAKPDVLILDEATADLEEDYENKLIKNIIENFKYTTIIAISHNPAIQSHFDNIIRL